MKLKGQKSKICALLLATTLSTGVFIEDSHARPMITDLSDRLIKINAKFSGKDILVYGARIEAGDIIIVVRGPNDNYIVRKKENIGGVWVNTGAVEFADIPRFYQIAATNKLGKKDTKTLMKSVGIGFDTLRFNGEPSSASVEIGEYERALKSKLALDGLYDFEVINLPFLEGVLFRIRVDFPAHIVDGIYTVEIYSFDDGQLLGMQSIPIEARKSGMEAFVHDAAHEYPALYGLAAILIAIGTGLVAGRLFKKF